MDAREAVVVSLLMTSHAFMLRPDFADTTRLGPRRSFVERSRAGAAARSRRATLPEASDQATSGDVAGLARRSSRARALSIPYARDADVTVSPPTTGNYTWDAVTEATRVRQWSVLGRTRLLTAELNNRTPAFANSSSDVCGVR